MASENVIAGDSGSGLPELRKQALQSMLEFVRKGVSGHEDTSTTADLSSGKLNMF